MCTVNSLVVRLIQSTHGTILLAILLCSQVYSKSCENSSCAHLNFKKSNNLASSIIAESDRRIYIHSLNRCDTTITLPAASITIMPGCNQDQVTTLIGPTRLSTNGGSVNLRTGIHEIVYCVEDDCGTFDCDTMILTILDAAVPNLSCKPDAVISLNSEGEGVIPAEELDGGSFDNCGHVFFKVKRMNIPTGYSCNSSANPNNQFDDKVKFCCADITNSPIQVIVRIYDVFPGDGLVHDSLLAPHFVDCMVMVNVIDKIPPTVICPTGTSINCGDDVDVTLNSLRPIYEDNCSSVRIDSQIIKRINSCGYGTINRSYVFSDTYGSITNCNQTITIKKNTNFDGLDPNQLRWPANKTIYACRINADTITVDKPIIVEDECDNVLVRSSDNLYYFNKGGVCGKLLRFWEVINYCVYDRNFGPNPNVAENGYYSYYQEIKIIDTIPPSILNVRDTLLRSHASDCGLSQFTLPSAMSMDCGFTSNLSFRYEVDYNSNLIIDRSGNGPDASGLFPMGIHKVTYFVKDSCNNIASKTIQVTVKDAKSPSAIVLYGIGTSLNQMSTGVMATIHASQFNNKSEDNCTASNDLRFSFSLDINDTIRVYNCNDQGVQNVSIYVWDECMNYTAVNSYLTVLDVDGVCPTTTQNLSMSGIIRTTQSQNLANVEVYMNDSIHFESSISNQKGEYSFRNIPEGMNFNLFLSCKDNPIEGVSTADIVKIQQHILGKKLMIHPYELIAADVDMNGRITSADISYMRKLILGINSTWPNQQTFVFLDKLYEFKNRTEPWQECAEQSIRRISNYRKSTELDFVGIKIGDVNSSLQVRSINKEIFAYTFENNTIQISSIKNRKAYGMQIELDLFRSGLTPMEIKDVTSTLFDIQYNIHNGHLIISLISNEVVELSAMDNIINIHFSSTNISSEERMLEFIHGEWIDQELVISSVEFERLKNINNQDFIIESYGPNPITEDFNIYFDVKENVKILLEIVSQEGKIILKKRIKLDQVNKILNLQRADFGSSGIYTLRILSAKKNWTQKLFIK